MTEPQIQLPPLQLSLGLVKQVKPRESEAKRVELGEVPKTPLIGQVYLCIQMPGKLLMPMRMDIEGVGMALKPLASRWYCDECDECKAALFAVLCRAKGVTPEEEKDANSAL